MNQSFAPFVLRRTAAAVVFVFLAASSAFFLAQLAPGDAATHLELSNNPEAAAAMRARLGLDRPVLSQFGTWLAGAATGDLGESTALGRPVAELVGTRLVSTARLAALALLLATAIGVPAGVLTASMSEGRAVIPAVLATVLLACPPIMAALALMFLAVRTGWLSTSQGALALPVLALALPMAAVLERVQARASAEALNSPGIAAAAARGIPRARLVWIHAFRPALVPVLGVYGIVMATLFSGSVAVETMTGWPGLAGLMVQAVLNRDLLLVTGCAAAVACMIAVAQLAADLLRGAIDPRTREGR